MQSTLKLLLVTGLLFSCLPAFAQKKYNEYSTNTLDSRFTIIARYSYSSMSEWEEVVYYVQNHTNRELQLELEATVYYTCDRTKTYLLGVNKVVYLPPNGQFEPKSDWSHLEMTSNKKKECLLKGPNGYTTAISSFRFKLISVRDLTTEKANKQKEEDEKKKLAEDAKAKKEKFNEQIRIADQAIAAKDYKQAETALKEADRLMPENTIVSRKRDQIKNLQDKELLAAKKKEEDELQKKKSEAAAVTAQGSVSGTVSGSGSGSSSSTGSSKGSSGSGSSKLSSSETNNVTTSSAEDAQQKQLDYEESQRQAREAAARQEEARKAAEEQAAKERQQKYDEWKEKKNQERQVQEAASMAASATFLYYFAGIIYDGMDSYNPDLSYQEPSRADKYKPVLYAGVEVGYSGSYFPMLFNSKTTTMVNGNYVNENSITTTDAATVNLNVTGKIGLESESYGAFVYLAPQAGFSPIFDGYHLSPLVGGIRAYGGLKWIKGYMDYRTGSRQYYSYSLDAEEYGDGNYNNNFSRMEYGVRFTTNADTDYRRSHISIGLIAETYNAEGIGMYLDPSTNTLRSGKTPVMQGYALQWKKDHMFNLYLNVFPEYIYGGDVSYDSGPLKSSVPGSGVFVEVGFIRSFDFFGRF